jgi:hypothetical protein
MHAAMSRQPSAPSTTGAGGTPDSNVAFHALVDELKISNTHLIQLTRALSKLSTDSVVASSDTLTNFITEIRSAWVDTNARVSALEMTVRGMTQSQKH